MKQPTNWRLSIAGAGSASPSMVGVPIGWHCRETGGWSRQERYCGDQLVRFGGNSDWRLPNVNELESLVNADEADIPVWLNGQGFSSVVTGYYWSSTTYAPDTNHAWNVDMISGNMGMHDNNKTTRIFVLAVRAGQQVIW